MSTSTYDLTFDFLAETSVPDDIDHQVVERVVRCVLDGESATGAWEITVVLVDDDRLRILHRDFMDIDEPTDIMTFPAEEVEIGEHSGGGEIIISVDRAAAQCAEYGHSPSEEIRYLVSHGVLHLCGWDDLAPGAREIMLARQDELLRGCGLD